MISLQAVSPYNKEYRPGILFSSLRKQLFYFTQLTTYHFAIHNSIKQTAVMSRALHLLKYL